MSQNTLAPIVVVCLRALGCIALITTVFTISDSLNAPSTATTTDRSSINSATQQPVQSTFDLTMYIQGPVVLSPYGRLNLVNRAGSQTLNQILNPLAWLSPQQYCDKISGHLLR